MGDLWAGAEVQLLSLMRYLVRVPGFEWSVVLFNEGRLAEELRKLPVSLTIIPEQTFSTTGIAYRLAKTLRKFRPDVVHTHKYKDSFIGTLVAKAMGIPHVVRIVHGLPEPFKGLRNAKMAGYTAADRFITDWLVDRVVAVSSDIEKVLVGRYGSNRVQCIHNGIDLEAVRVTTSREVLRRTWQIAEDAVIIGTAGRLVPVKGHATLLEATKILRASKLNVILLLVGDGPLRSDLEANAKRLGLENAAIFTGHQDHAYDCLNLMDIFVLPSLHEGIPMVLLEALALNRPVVATNVGGIPEVIAHDLSGKLVHAGEADELARALAELIEKPDTAKLLGIQGRRHVEREFSASIMAERTAGLYRSLCQS
ncbi:MAG: glycosyltransferase [Nitrospira sp.]|nr:glycosyltransferase [Nitrospira sp.]